MLRTKKKSYWEHEPLTKFIRELILEGALKRPNAHNYIVSQVEKHKEIGPYLKEAGHRFTKASLRSRLDSLTWGKTESTLLDEYAREGWPVDRLYKTFAHIPKDEVDRKIKYIRGKGRHKKPAVNIPGILRVIPEGHEVKLVDLPKTDLSNPIIIPDDVNGVFLVGALLLGLPYDGRMSHNFLRCLMEYAERERFAVVFTGGLMHLRVKMSHANTRNRHAHTSAIDLDLEVIDPMYAERAKQIMESGNQTPIYTTLLEDLENLLGGFKKTFYHSEESGGKPRYTVPVFFQLGAGEEELVRMLTHWELRSQTLKAQKELQRDIAMVRAEMKHDPINPDLEEELQILLRELSRTVQTNISKDNDRRATERVRSYFVNRLIEALPGAMLLGIGNSYCRYRGKTIHFAEFGGETPTGNHLDGYIKRRANHKTKLNGLADVVAVVNRWTTHHSHSLIADGKFSEPRVVHAVTLAPAFDGEFVKNKFALAGLLGSGATTVEKLVGDQLFQPSVLLLNTMEGLVQFSSHTIRAVQHLGGPEKLRDKQKLRDGSKYVNIGSTSDLHSGHAWEWHVFDSEERKLLDLTSAWFKILRTSDGFGRLHMYGFEDDLAHGLNHAYYLEPHEQKLSLENLHSLLASYRLRIARARSANNRVRVEILEAERDQLVLWQKVYSGEYRGQEQLLKLIYGMVNNCADGFANIIQTFAKTGLVLESVGKNPSFTDSRDLTVIWLPNGNHWQNAHGQKGMNTISEGSIVGEVMKPRIALCLPRELQSEVLKRNSRYIGYPMHGQDFLGLGRLITGRGGRYGLHMRGNPARKGPANGFGLENAAKNAIERGNHTGAFHDLSLEVQMTGDIHKGGYVLVPNYLHVSCPAATAGDPYGKHGFARSHVGGVVVSLPVVGENFAPIKITFITEDWIRDWFKSPRKVDWKAIIPDPL
jgi:hypothetical protein